MGDVDDVDIVARAIAILDEEVRAWAATRDEPAEHDASPAERPDDRGHTP